jgi:hypothetical protein
VAAQREVACLGRDGGSPETGVAHATGHGFQRNLSLRTRCSKGNSPKGPSSGGGGRSRARDGGHLATTFGVIDDELQRAADNEIRESGGGATRRRTMWHRFSGCEASNSM